MSTFWVFPTAHIPPHLMPTPHTEQTQCRVPRVLRSGKCHPTSRIRPTTSGKGKEQDPRIPQQSHWLHHQKGQRVWCSGFLAVVGCELAGSITAHGAPQAPSRSWRTLTTRSLGHRLCPTGPRWWPWPGPVTRGCVPL